MKHSIIIILIALLSGATFVVGEDRANAQQLSQVMAVVNDPAKDFLDTMFRKPLDDLFILETDVNGKGKKAMFFTYSHNVNGKAGNIWTAYIPVEGGYRQSNQLLTFDMRTLYVGHCEELNATGIITYYPGGGGQGSLTGYTFDGQYFTQIVAKDIEPAGKDQALFTRLFTTPSKIQPKVIPHTQLPATSYRQP